MADITYPVSDDTAPYGKLHACSDCDYYYIRAILCVFFIMHIVHITSVTIIDSYDYVLVHHDACFGWTKKHLGQQYRTMKIKP